MQWIVIAVSLLGIALGEIVLEEHGYLRLPGRGGSKYLFGMNAASESTFDSRHRYLYVIGTEERVLHQIRINSNGTYMWPELVHHYDLPDVDDGNPLDVEVCYDYPKGYFVISFEGKDDMTSGHVNFYDLPTSDGAPLNLLQRMVVGERAVAETIARPPLKRSAVGSILLSGPNCDFGYFQFQPVLHNWFNKGRVVVGSHPENMKFTSDCSKLVVSDEGIPYMEDGTKIDPEGQINIINVANYDRSTLGFAVRWNNDQNAQQNLIDGGYRYWMKDGASTFSRNIEPEHIAINSANNQAFITLQENNALCIVNLTSNSIQNIYPMGTKNWNSHAFSLDVSDRDVNNGKGIVMKRRKIKSFFQPDKIAYLKWDNKDYIVTADEGRKSNLPALSFTDNERAAALDWSHIADSVLKSELEDNAEMGRLHVSTVDTGSPDEVFAFGGRGFSIWESLDNFGLGGRVYESGDDAEIIGAANYPLTFNGDCSTGTRTPVQEADSRSPNMGPEINSLDIGEWEGITVLFLGSGRNGNIYVYAINPEITTYPTPVFQHIHRRGGEESQWNTLYSQDMAGDAGINDMRYIDIAGEKALAVIASKSSSVSLYRLVDGARDTMPSI